MVQRLLGHAMFLCVLHRGGMSIFRHLYDFVEARGEPRFLNNSERREVKNFIGVVPLLYGSLRRPWSTTATATDASPEGFGICERVLPENDIRHMGRWQEKWRFRHLPPELWRPRQRAMQGQDVFSNIDTACGGSVGHELEEVFWEDPNFPEVPHKIMTPHFWKTVKFGKWKNTNESITIKEGRALVLAVRRLCRSFGSRNKRHLFFVDNLSLAFSVGKGRASNYSLLRINQQLSALSLAGHFTLRVRWVASELNVADGPSRGQIMPGAYQAKFGPEDPIQTNLSHSEAERGAETKAKEFSSPAIGNVLKGGITECVKEKLSPPAEGIPEAGRKEYSEANHSEDGNRSDGGWEVGSQEAIDFSGAVLDFSVLQEVREFLPGVKASKTTPSLHRQSHGRLHGHPFHGGKDSQRGRKNLGKCRIQTHRVEGQNAKKPKGPEGMEERETAGESLTHSCFGDERHCHGPHSPESAAHGAQGPSRFRHLSQGSPSGATGDWGRSSISLISRGHSRVSGRSARQDRSFRQQCGFKDNPQRSWLGEALFGHSKTVNSKDDFLFQFKMEAYRHAFSKAGESLGISGLHPYQLRHGGAAEDLNSKTRDCPSVKARGRWMTDQSVRRYTKVGKLQDLMTRLSPASLECCRWCQRNMEKVIRGLVPPRSPSFQRDVFADKSLPRRFSLELFAGTARIAKEMCRRGLQTYPIDICLFEHHNILDADIEHCIFNWVRGGRIRFIWMGMPCTSFSRARKWDGMGPGPLRSDSCLWGFHHLATLIEKRLKLVTRFCYLQFDFCAFANNIKCPMFWKTLHQVGPG